MMFEYFCVTNVAQWTTALSEQLATTRMRSNKMRTTRVLTVSRNSVRILEGEGVLS